MKNVLLLLAFFCGCFSVANAQFTYEDFEGIPLPWAGINGTYDGVVANPDATGINTSAMVGSYTTNDMSDFNFAIADLAAPADMANFGLVKVKIYSPIAPTQALLKFEGSGPPVEKFIQVTTAGEWVEYSLDLTTGAANPTGLTKCLISFNSFLPGVAETFYWDDIVGFEAKACYETFESGNELGWQGLDGMFTGPVANPGPNSVNSSAMCGQYVKSDMHSFSLLLAESATPYDMSALNQFQIDVYATAATQVLLKMEGAGGPPVEATRNIGFADNWQTYTFDLSAAADFDYLTKIILFFDPGVETSADTYYFDNLCAVAQGACAGVDPNPDLIDDFECNRNATYVNGWDSLSVVTNPTPDLVNMSSHVGQYIDPLGEPFGALLIDYQNPIDLSERNQLKAKIWSPKAAQILFKLEGGASSANEVWVDIPEANKWVDYEVDFSSQALNFHQKIVFFFNGGQDGEPGDIYYIDDIQWGEKSATVLDDFENGATLPWEPLEQQTVLHGAFEVVANPAPDGVNGSDNVGKYTKGTAAFSTVAAVAPGVIDISTKPQYNVDVWAPVGSTEVTMQLESTTQGNKEVTREITNAGNWETISFNFTDQQAITDWIGIRLLFNPGVAEAGAMFFFDNLTQTAATVDPCEGTVVIPNIIDDFECQRNYPPTNGASLLEVVANPAPAPLNGSTLVGKFDDPANTPWEALCFDFPAPIDLSVFNQLSMMVLADAAVPILMKLEGGSSPAAEIWTDYTNAGEWQRITVDFSMQAGMEHQKVCFFFDGGVEHPDVITYHIDNITFSQAPFNGCLMNFDEDAFTSTVWNYFPADDAGDFELVDNPDPTGINTSAKVGKAVEKSTTDQPWQGMFTDLPSYIDLNVSKIVKMKIWSPQIASVTMKLENPQTPGAPGSSGDNTVANTTMNQWEELSFDFENSPTPLPADGNYTRVTLIWDIDNIPTSDVTYYFDDIRLDGGSCGIAGNVFQTPDLEPLHISPNPVSDVLTVENLGDVSRLEIYNLLGARVADIWTGTEINAYLNMGNLQTGLYTMAGFNKEGQMIANAKFVKQ